MLVGALECGQMVLMSAGMIDGQRVTGYRVVRPFLSRLGTFVDEPVVVDGNLITGRDSDATPSFVRALARCFQPDWEDPTVDLLAGKRIVIVAGQDFEDVELCVPAMEFDQRGARVILGTFPAPVVSRPPMLGVHAVMGNFGMSVPFQELDDTRYPVVPLADPSLDDFDAVIDSRRLLPLELPGRGFAGGAVPARRRGRQGGGGHLPRAAGAGRRRPGGRPPHRPLHRVPRRRDHHGRALRLRLAGDDRRQHRHRPRPRRRPRVRRRHHRHPVRHPPAGSRRPPRRRRWGARAKLIEDTPLPNSLEALVAVWGVCVSRWQRNWRCPAFLNT